MRAVGFSLCVVWKGDVDRRACTSSQDLGERFEGIQTMDGFVN